MKRATTPSARMQLFAIEPVGLKVLKQIVVGRGLGRHTLYVGDFGLVGKNGRSYHVLNDGKPICHVRGEVSGVENGVDARAHAINRLPVCVNCIELLGEIPTPQRVEV